MPTGDHLPETAPLTLDEPLDVAMVRGINRFAERELAASRDRRTGKWNRDYSSREAYQKSVEPNRRRLAERIGATDELSPPRLLKPDDSRQSGVAVQWDVIEGVSAEGLLLVSFNDDPQNGDPDTTDPDNLLGLQSLVVVIPDPTQSPEQIAGILRDPLKTSLGAFHNCLTLIVANISRSDELSGHPDIRWTNLPHREFVYRCGFELGRHPVGYEVQIVRQAVKSLRSLAPRWGTTAELPCGVLGIGDGGLVALYAAAIDPDIDAVHVAGYFNEREDLWREPIDRNVFGLLNEFGDADIASLVAPRALIIDNSPPPTWDGPAAGSAGRLPYAAPGRIVPPAPDSVRQEFHRAREHYARLNAEPGIRLFEREDGQRGNINLEALAAFFSALGNDEFPPREVVHDHQADLAQFQHARQKRLVESLVRHTQTTLHRSDKVREKFWKDADRSSVEKWVETSQWYRDYVHDRMIGRLPLPTAPLNARSRKVIDEPEYVGYEVVLDVYSAGEGSGVGSQESGDGARDLVDPGVIAGGILLVPKDLKPEEKRPVVVCQHGLEGTPMDTITEDQSAKGWGPYKAFSVQLLKRGYIVYAPQNPYRGRDEFRVIQRKSNPLGRSLFSYIIEQHRQTLKWLATLPFVDPERIAFYGLSYGGKTAVRAPPLLVSGETRAESGGNRDEVADSRLAGDESPEAADTSLSPPLSALRSPGYCLSICSADFNEWIRKNASSEDRYSYVFTIEYEMFEWNMGHIAGYAELASLMAPRPFMVERGHDDRVAPDEWVGWEYAKVRRHYVKLGLGDRTEIEWFDGPHTINGQGTFRFLQEHLDWPPE